MKPGKIAAIAAMLTGLGRLPVAAPPSAEALDAPPRRSKNPVRSNRLTHLVHIFRQAPATDWGKTIKGWRVRAPQPTGHRFRYRTGQLMEFYTDGSIRRVFGSGESRKAAKAALRQIAKEKLRGAAA